LYLKRSTQLLRVAASAEKVEATRRAAAITDVLMMILLVD
jgi:hypothetical protein